MIKTKNPKITRHGTFLSKNTIDTGKIIKLLKLEILNYLKHNTKKKLDIKKILNDILTSLEDFDETRLEYIFDDDEKNDMFISYQEILWLSKRNRDLWVPYIIYRYKFKIFSKKKIPTNFPPYLLIEPTSVCNIRCVMCFQADSSFSKNKSMMGFMDLNLFKKIISEAKKNDCNAVTLASRGEPTLHKQFTELCNILKKANFLDLKLNTNATVLDEKKIHAILSTNFSEVIFSVDAGTKETYEKIRVLGKFEKVVNNIKLFNEIRLKYYPNSCTTTRISGVKVSTDQDLEQMSRFWSKYVDEVSIKEASPRWDTYNNKKNNEINPCLNLWYRMYVWYDGAVNPCDFDYKSFLKMGNVTEDRISDIWKNKFYKNLRNDHLSKNRKKHTPCDRCPITS